MITLLQLIKIIDKDSLLSWMELIEQDNYEIYEFNDILLDNGIELTGSQLDSLLRSAIKGSYHAAFNLAA